MNTEPEMSASALLSPFEIGSSAAALLDAIRRAGIIARSELPDVTMLSQQSVHRLTEDLVERGLLALQPAMIVGRGKPSPRLALEPDGAFGVGVAIDSDSISVAVTNLTGDMLHHHLLDVDATDPEAVVPATHAVVKDLVRDLSLSPERIAGLGVSMQGFRAGERACFSPSLPLAAWSTIDMEKRFAADSVWPVYAENNATLGAVSELWAGAGRRFSTFAYLSINYGFGGGIVLNGTPYLGHHLNAGEISSIYSDQEHLDRPALSSLLDMLQDHGIDVRQVRDLRDRYDPAWPAIDAWVERVTPALNQMLRALTGILDPAAIVFGGEAPMDIRQRLMAAASPLDRDRIGRPTPGPDLLLSGIEVDPSVLGAALLPIRRRLFAGS